MLGLFDTDAEIVNSDLFYASKLHKRILRQFPKLVWVIRSLIDEPAQTIAYQKKFLRTKTNEILVALGLRKEAEPDEIVRDLSPIMAKVEHAYHKHVIRPFNGHVTLFRAKKRPYFVADSSFLGWKKYALKGVTVYEVPGDHKTMFEASHAQETARIIQKALNESA